MKIHKLKRFLALAVAISVILSNVSLPVYADEGTVQAPSGGLTEHIHGEECHETDEYSSAAAETEATVPSEETEATEATEAAETMGITETTEITEEIKPVVLTRVTSQSQQKLHTLELTESEGMELLALSENQPMVTALDISGTLDGSYFQSGGAFQLSGDVILTSRMNIRQNVTVEIDLNGYVLAMAGNNQLASVEGQLIIKDSRPNEPNTNGGIGGLITGIGNSGNYGGAVCVEASGVLVIEGGTISGFKGDRGGAIHSVGAIYLSGGTITGNSANYAGAINSRGFFQMTGGTISNNAAVSGGGGITIGNGTFTMTGGTICNNKADNGGGIYVWKSNWDSDWDATKPDVNISGGIIRENNATTGGGLYAQRGIVTMGGTAAITANHSTSYGGGVYSTIAFHMTGGTISDNQAGTVTGEDAVDKLPTYSSVWGGGAYIAGPDARFTMDAGSITNNTAASGGGVGVWNNSYGSATFIMNGGTISYNKAYGIGGPGNGGAAYVNGSTFEFNGGTIEHNWARRYGGAINLNEGGKMIFTGSEGECIIQNNSANNGGGVSQEQGKCEISISSDNIIVRNNTARDDNRAGSDHLKADGCGGGFFIEKGKFEMTAGSISNNTAVTGGGVALRVQRIAGDITVNVTGGTISDNIATSSGGGVDIFAEYNITWDDPNNADDDNFKNDVVVNLVSGTFSGNQTTNGTGGGIDIWVNEDNSTASLYIGATGTDGPILHNNSASVNGGAIRMRSGHVYLYSGTIFGNSAGLHGGGITVNGGNFEMHGGTIGGDTEDKANTAVSGAGISILVQEFASDVEVLMTGGKIINNIASLSGGGMDIAVDCARESGKNDVKVYLHDGTFEANKTTNGTGGGIDIEVNEDNSTAVLYLGASESYNGPTFLDNSASTNGGAIRMRNGSVYLYRGEIVSNTSQLNGGAISINGGNFTLTGGSICRNEVKAGYGGAIALSNGKVLVSGGSILENTAKIHGGGITVSDGEVIMTGGDISDNIAETGNGGGIYVISTGAALVATKIFSGTISRNQAPNGSGGAVAVNGGTGDTEILVHVGINLRHSFTGEQNSLISIPHDRDGQAGTEFSHTYCPVITANSSLVSGGGIFITGGSKTNLNIYCLEASDNMTENDADHMEVLSKFMMVEGGVVTISSAGTDENGESSSEFGNTSVHGSIHVLAGELHLYGSMENSTFEDVLTVDYRNPGDTFVDNRTSDTMLKLTYNENFTDAAGNPDSTLKAYDIQKGDVVTIAELLFNHPGYTIKEWNTKPDGSGITYKVGDQYLFIKNDSEKNDYTLENGQEFQVDDLNLYAIWEVNSFIVKYHHDIPEGEIYSGNMDGEHLFTYHQVQKLRKNAFVYPGYTFQYWRYTKDDGTQATLIDEQEVSNLTDVRGGIVHLYAVWETCEHEFEYTVSGATMTKTCKKCTKSATVTIVAEDTVYDGNLHMYTVVYSDKEFFGPEITCTAVKHGKNEVPEKMYIDAGVYTVTTNEPEANAQATLTYRLEKAAQKAPESLPEYKTPEGNDVVTIYQKNEELLSPESGALIEYTLRYTKQDGTSGELHWKSDENGSNITFDLPEALTIYSVYSRYPETDNYQKSPERIAMSSFFFDGGITVVITPTPGVTYTSVQNENSLDIVPQLEPGYYLDDDNFIVEIQKGNDGGYISINGQTSGKIGAIDLNENKIFQITSPKTPTTPVEIYLELGYARKATTIDSKIAPNQVFGAVSGSEATISWDSAYTVCFEVDGYNSAVYTAPVLTFSNVLPVGTKLILQDKVNGTYWSYAISDSDVSEISLADKNFVRMGGSDFFDPKETDLKLQFVVDFSRADPDHIRLSSPLNTRLVMTKKDGAPKNAPDLSLKAMNPGVDVNVITTSFGLIRSNNSDQKQTLTYSFSGENANVSKWDHREAALILRPRGTLPADAVITATQNEINIDYRSIQLVTTNGTETVFMIPLDGFSGDVSLRLQSAMTKIGNYSMSAQLVMAQSIAEDAPVNGTVVASLDELQFFISDTALAMKVTEANACHLFEVGDTMNINIQLQPTSLPTGYKLIAAQEQKKDNDANYSFYGVYYDTTKTDSGYALAVPAPTSPGNYRIRFYIESQYGTNVLETVYYFIVD